MFTSEAEFQWCLKVGRGTGYDHVLYFFLSCHMVSWELLEELLRTDVKRWI